MEIVMVLFRFFTLFLWLCPVDERIAQNMETLLTYSQSIDKCPKFEFIID